jgi:hypothetical protein
MRRIAVIVVVAATLIGAGCSNNARDYTPSPSVAEDAIRQALEMWKAGLPAGPVPDSKPVVHVTDAGRKPGQTLESYDLLGETRGTGGRSYAVALHLANPEEEIKTKYLVVGIDPLWVFRQEDYELLMHWDHHMPEPKDGALPEEELGAARP